MNCQTCNQEITGMACEPCLIERSRIELRKLVIAGATRADFYQFRDVLHVFDKAGKELHASPDSKRSAWCGAVPHRRGRSPLSNVTFSTRTFLDKVSGPCKACLESAK